ncbi:uncharacterized protein LOC113308908 [Papaver somniferum]|uniref:uncharacterized protein LOC113308908 n=1 Tax=Papaver somniferum TaxID=3469 RepID=UPI000E6FDB20|nr:uncharacterized protein LOC113308908 [Papaver somniferum]
METPEYLWRPAFSDSNAMRLPVLEKAGYEEEEEDPGCGFVQIKNKQPVHFIDTKNILIGLECKSSGFASLLVHMKVRPVAPVDALISIELVHNHHFETGETSKNRCLNRILSFSEQNYKHKFDNCFQIEKAKSEGFMITRPTQHGSEDGFMFLVYVNILRRKTDPGTYLSAGARSFMLACYGTEVTHKIRDVCSDCVQSLEKNCPAWFSQDISVKKRLTEMYLGSLDKSAFLPKTRDCFKDTCILYPLIMELLNFGIENADKEADYAIPGLDQLIAISPEGSVSLMHDLGTTLKKVRGYKNWVRNIFILPSITGNENTFGDQLLDLGWGAIQLIFTSYYSGLVDFDIEIERLDKLKLDALSKSQKKRWDREPKANTVPVMHDVTPANAPSPTVPDAPSLTVPDAPSLTVPDAQSSAESFDNIIISTELQELNGDGSVSWIEPSDMSDGVVSRIDYDGAEPANAPSPTVPDAPSPTVPDAPSLTVPDAQSSAGGLVKL